MNEEKEVIKESKDAYEVFLQDCKELGEQPLPKYEE